MKTILTLLLALALGNPMKFDKTVHDFGQIGTKDGPVSCVFEVTNEGSEDFTIFAVVSSCGCTDVKWTRESIAPGESGKITATYNNDEGPFTFDKTLTVYTSAQDKPVILHLKGQVVKNKRGSRK